MVIMPPSPPLLARVSSSSLILAFDTQILVYSITSAELINSIKLPDIPADNGNANKITTRDKSAKGSPEPLVIIACRVSPDARLCCVADSYKRLLIYDTTSWTLMRQLSTERRVSLIAFNSTGTRVLVADRTGDVYLIDFEKTDSDANLLMGHLSIILSLELTPDDKFVVTADRDEKIRVSHFPNSYNIQSYCLGHREFVSSAVVLDPETLISGSGDGTIRLWNLVSGKLISSLDCGTDHNVKQILRISRQLIAVSFYCSTSVMLYNLTDDSGITQQGVIDAPGEVLGMELLDQDSVVLLTRSPDQPLALIHLSRSSISGSSAEASGDEKLQNHSSRYQKLLASVNSLEGLRASMKQGSDAADLKLLKKEAYDNVNEYLLRKQERLENRKPHEDEDHQNNNDDDAGARKKTRLNHSPSKDQAAPVGIPKLE